MNMLPIFEVLFGLTLLLQHDCVSSFAIGRPCFLPTRRLTSISIRSGPDEIDITWSPQDLTKNKPGFLPIPDDDYIKLYQEHTQLWPVEFFVIAYRRIENKSKQQYETQILVRKSANGTSKYGLGTGVPATRWVLSSQTKPPTGYAISKPTTFEWMSQRCC